MKPWARELVLGLLLSAAIPWHVALAADPAEQVLLDKANFWRLKDRPDLALQALNQLLTLNPSQPDALYQYGMLEVQQNNIPAARQYLARLREVAPSNPRISNLVNAIRAGQVSKGELNEARRLAQSGHFAAATRQYQQTFQGEPPPPTFGVEYYLTMAGTRQGVDAARRGLEQLAQSSPNNPRIKVALAQVLTYEQATRHQGIADLAGLSRDPIAGASAAAAWRQALMWLGDSASDKALYNQYLAQYPQDTVIRQHVAEVARTGVAVSNPFDEARTQGYADLRRGNTGAAEREFTADLRARPGDPDALGGLGIIRLRQQRFSEARDLLGRAMRAAPGERSKWAAAYDAAVSNGELQSAKAAIASGNLTRARSLLSGLAARGGRQGAGADALLGDVDAKLGDNAGAEAAYRRALAAQPDNSGALLGLYTALTAEGKTAEAATLATRLSTADRGQLAGADRVRAQILRTEANGLEARGEAAQAMTKYQEAIATDPRNPWVRLDFARFLARHGELSQAFVVVEPSASGNTASSLQAAAIFDGEQNRFPEALALLDRIPAGERNAEITSFRDQIQVTAEIARAKDLAREGQPAAARATLIALYDQPPMTAQKARLVADALSDIGDTQQALQIDRAVVAHGGPGTTQAKIDYAGLLLKTGRDAEAVSYVTELENRGGLNADQLRSLEDVKANIAASRADRLRTRGNLAGAYDQVSSLLAAYPNNPSLLLATGRIYASAGQDSEAMRFVDAAYQQDPTNFEVIRGAVGGAIQAKDLSRARAYLAQGMRLFPNNARLYYLAAEIDRAAGDNGTAMRSLETARALNGEETGAALPNTLPGVAPGSLPGVPGGLPQNPFRSSQASPAQAVPYGVASITEPSAAVPAPAQLDLASADSADLAVPPDAGARPGSPTAAVRMQQEGAAATQRQVAELPGYPIPEGAAPASDLGPAPLANNSQPTQLAQLEPLPPPPVPGYQAPSFAVQSGAVVPQDSLGADIQQSMAAIEAQNNPMVAGGLDLRYRTGEAGLGKLTEFGVPAEASFSPFYTGTLRFAAVPTFLTGGTPSGTSVLKFGTNPIVGVGDLLAGENINNLSLPNPGDQNAAGVALSAAYSYQNFAGSVGTSPLGFPVTNLLGSIAFSFPGGAPSTSVVANPIPLAPISPANPFQVTVEGTRAPVTDSVLSYAGTRDPATGQTWGGVVKTGGTLNVSYDDGEVGAYANGGYGVLDGDNVQSNSEFDGTIGGFVRPYRQGEDSFKVGVNLTYLSYDRNLSFFTFGQGGYFSPQNYVNFSVPLEYSGRSGRFTYLAAGGLGIQSFNYNSSPFFPTNAGYQGVFGPFGYYPSSSVTGPSFNLKGQIEYKLDNGFTVGGLASVDNAQNYTEGIAKVYLRKTFGISAPTGVLPDTGPGNL